MSPVAPGVEVAVTGASGFIGSHVCAALLRGGFKVRAVVRDPNNEEKTAHLRALEGATDGLTFHKGELLEEGSYDEAFKGVSAVIHTAAVVEINDVKDAETTIVRPSVDGVANVLACAKKAGSVRRFIHTSSIAAIQNHTADPDTTFSSSDWNEASTVENGDPYGYAKTMAERKVHEHGGDGFDCVCICPGVVLGPSLCKAHTKASVVVVRQMLYGNPQPVYESAFTDVRDVAEGHVKALGLPENATARRFLLCSDSQMPVSDLEQPMQKLFPDYQIDVVDRLGGLGRAVIAIPLLWRAAVTEYQRAMLASKFRFDNAPSKSELGISYRSLEDTLRDSVTAMVEPGFVKPRNKK